MPSTFLSLHYHLVWSTKDRIPCIQQERRDRLHEYLGGTVNGLDGRCGAVGGTTDHVHVLVELRATHMLADFMRELKKASSIWVHQKMAQKEFAWQEGYAGFTLAATSVEAVRKYIQNQEEHHRKRSFREELEEMLQRAGVAYDPWYLD